MNIKLLFPALLCISLLTFAGCNVDPETVRDEIKDSCVTAVRDFVKFDLQGLALLDSCLRDLATGYCIPATCLSWLNMALPDECSDPAKGYGFLKKDGKCGVCPNYLSWKLKDNVLKAMCATAKEIATEEGAIS